MPENKGCVLKEPRLFYHPHIDDLHSETKMIGGHRIADLPIFRRKNYAFTGSLAAIHIQNFKMSLVASNLS